MVWSNDVAVLFGGDVGEDGLKQEVEAGPSKVWSSDWTVHGSRLSVLDLDPQAI